MVGAATAKLRELKHVRTRGTDSKLVSDERKLRDGIMKRTSPSTRCLTLQLKIGTW